MAIVSFRTLITRFAELYESIAGWLFLKLFRMEPSAGGIHFMAPVMTPVCGYNAAPARVIFGSEAGAATSVPDRASCVSSRAAI